MAGFSSSFTSIMCLASLMVLLMMNNTEAQDTPSCASELIACVDYLNSTKPPSTCCDPLKKTVETQLTCLCNIFNTPGLLQSFNVNINQALALSKNCGVTSDLSSCKQGSAPPPTAGSPPATKGGDDKGAAGRVSFTGFSFLLLLVSMMMFN